MQVVRQLPNVGMLIGQRLQAARLGSFQALLQARPHQVEMAAQKNHPFGKHKAHASGSTAQKLQCYA